MSSPLRVLVAAAPLAAGCTGGALSFNGPIYFDNPTPVLELQGNEMIPRITNGFSLRFRQPTQDEQKTLDDEKQARGGKYDIPWVSRDKVHLELLFTVKNLDTTPGTFDVLVDGANQYTKYDENVVAMTTGMAGNANDPPVYVSLMNLHPSPLPMTLDPGGVYQGVIREDDFNEGELDLDAIGRWQAPYAAVLINRSEVNPIGLEMVPADVVVPALMEVDVTLTANKHMTCEWALRVRDDDDRLLHVDGDHLFHANPTLFVPVIPPKTP
ncbi:MAG TPA: hypothetical protein VHJ20_01570 [Polyangia bacterium]|nr:hypothetical protein [Polyangia bacterium]